MHLRAVASFVDPQVVAARHPAALEKGIIVCLKAKDAHDLLLDSKLEKRKYKTEAEKSFLILYKNC